MKSKSLLLSIKPRFADAIFAGTKSFELRKVRPRIVAGDLVLVYVTHPRAAIEGAFEVEEVIEAPPSVLWLTVCESCGITKSEFDRYYEGKTLAFAIRVRKTWPLPRPVTLQRLRKNKILPPQGYRYLDSAQTGGLMVGRLK